MKKVITCILILLTLTSTIFFFIDQTKADTSPTVALTPSQITVTQLNQVFKVNITISNVQNLWGWSARITWDPAVLNLVGAPIEGDFMTQVGTTQFIALAANQTQRPFK